MNSLEKSHNLVTLIPRAPKDSFYHSLALQFNMWLFATMAFCPKVYKIAQIS